MQTEISQLAKLEDTHKVLSQKSKANKDQYEGKEVVER
jgi:hypothetical protein